MRTSILEVQIGLPFIYKCTHNCICLQVITYISALNVAFMYVHSKKSLIYSKRTIIVKCQLASYNFMPLIILLTY